MPVTKIIEKWIIALGSTLILVMVFSTSQAEEIYKVLDEDGNVTYSTQPPESSQAAEVIQAQPEPTEEDVEAARQRQQKIEEDYEKLDQARAEQARLEAERRAKTTTTVVQTNTILGTAPLYHAPYRYWRGAPVAPGAPTAPGYRPPYYRPPGHRPPHYRPPRHGPRPPNAVPYSTRPGHRTVFKQ